jgi:hypothetical protein
MVLTPSYSDHLCFQFSRESLPPLDPVQLGHAGG